MKAHKGLIGGGAGTNQTKLYVTHANISQQVVNVAENDSKIELWHRRLGHMSEKSMTHLVKKNALPGLNQIQLKKCDDCLAGKQNRVSFKKFPPSERKKYWIWYTQMYVGLLKSPLVVPNIS